jgi:HK97 family phage prohead protease
MDKKVKKIQGFTAEIKASEDKREISAIGSSSNVDRDREVVSIKGLDIKQYKKNPVLLWAHDHRGLPIGKATSITKTKDGELKFKLEFAEEDVNPFADSVYKLYKAGFLNSFSIGFLPDYKEIEYDEKTQVIHINKSELLELSCVPIGANSDARVITRSVLDDAVKQSVLDDVEAKDFEITLKEYGIDINELIEEKSTEDDSSVKGEQTTETPSPEDVLLKRIDSLELRIKELESSDKVIEVTAPTSYLEELFTDVSDEKSTENPTEELAASWLE